jgi:hypothetical protein
MMVIIAGLPRSSLNHNAAMEILSSPNPEPLKWTTRWKAVAK